METIVANLSGVIRYVTWNGREYLVAPMTMIVPGVLEGSEGPILYPDAVVNQDPDAWNGMPIVLNHPSAPGPDGKPIPVSARTPAVLEQSGLGWVFNANVNGKLGAEGWFDIEKCNRVDHRIIANLKAGKPLELSTGLVRMRRTAAVAGSIYNGKPYSSVANGYDPDHLAVLPDKTGACSTADGCGVLVNADERSFVTRLVDWIKGQVTTPALQTTTTNEGDPMTTKLTPAQRTQIIDHLVANCDCWKFQGDAAILNTFTDDKLVKLRKGVDDHGKLSKLAAALVTNAKGDAPSGANLAELADFLGVTVDAATDPAGYISGILTAIGEIKERLVAAVMPDEEAVPDEPVVMEDNPTPPGVPAVTANKLLNVLQLAGLGAKGKPVQNTGRKPAATPPAQPRQPLSLEQWLQVSPPEVQNLVRNAARSEQRRKTQLVEQLTAHVTNAELKTRLAAHKMKLSVEELEDEVAALLPVVGNRQAPAGNDPLATYFHGAGGGPAAPVANQLPEDDGDILEMPVYNWHELASKGLTRQQA